MRYVYELANTYLKKKKRKKEKPCHMGHSRLIYIALLMPVKGLAIFFEIVKNRGPYMKL